MKTLLNFMDAVSLSWWHPASLFSKIRSVWYLSIERESLFVHLCRSSTAGQVNGFVLIDSGKWSLLLDSLRH
jgi:hypothetical protein